MTLIEKIMAHASGRKEVSAGDVVMAKVDLSYVGGASLIITYNQFKKYFGPKVHDPNIFVVHHGAITTPSSIQSAEEYKRTMEFANEQEIKHLSMRAAGSVSLLEKEILQSGIVKPGKVIVACDSHVTTLGAFCIAAIGLGSTDMLQVFHLGKSWFKVPETLQFRIEGSLSEGVMSKDIALHILRERGLDGAVYKAVEFCGDTIKNMSMDGRMTLCNMSAEMGAKAALVEADEKTIEYLGLIEDSSSILRADPTANYEKTYNIDVEDLVPLVAAPHNPANVRPVEEVKGTKVNEVFLGSCTNGRIEDLRMAAKIIKNGGRVAKSLRFIVIPANTRTYLDALQEGLIETLIEAGAAICNPGCGPCVGMHEGLLTDGEVALTTGSRNFIGRMGSSKAMVYVCSPAVAAASAIEGVIADPRDYL